MINQIYRQRGKRRREAKIFGYKWVHVVNGYERMRITSSGNVGIGTINPSYKMHIGK